MDEFTELAREDFENKQAFRHVPSGFLYQTISISASTTAPATYYQSDVELRQLVRFFKEGSENAAEGCPAKLRLVTIKSKVDELSNWSPKLWIVKDVFLELVDLIGIHHGALWLLLHQYDGFHQFSPSTQFNSTKTYYIGLSRYALVWTFNLSTLETYAIIIVRRQSPDDLVEGVAKGIIQRYREHIHSPVLLGFVCSLSLGRDFDMELESEQLSRLRSIEQFTGYGPDQSKIKGRIDIDFLTTSLQWIGEILNHVANKERHMRMLYSVIEIVADGVGDELSEVPIDASGKVRESTDKLVAALPPMRSRMDATQEYLKYMKERSERLSGVLFAMLTHEDAAVNLELADSSRRIAEASKHDSSAMKTIAIMTMAFLPATFFAALFAVPSLDWDSDDVVKGNFWVYWAFTLPATMLVFIIWILADDRITLMNLIRRPPVTEKLA